MTHHPILRDMAWTLFGLHMLVITATMLVYAWITAKQLGEIL